MRVRSFFSVKNVDRNGKICLQGYTGRVFFSPRCTRDVEVYAVVAACVMRLSSAHFAGPNPAVRKSVRQWFGFVPRDAKDGISGSCPVCERFFRIFVISRQGKKSFAFLSEQCKRVPCLCADTVLSRSVPKMLFRTVQGVLKPSAAALAWGMTKRIYNL